MKNVVDRRGDHSVCLRADKEVEVHTEGGVVTVFLQVQVVRFLTDGNGVPNRRHALGTQ